MYWKELFITHWEHVAKDGGHKKFSLVWGCIVEYDIVGDDFHCGDRCNDFENCQKMEQNFLFLEWKTNAVDIHFFCIEN